MGTVSAGPVDIYDPDWYLGGDVQRRSPASAATTPSTGRASMVRPGTGPYCASHAGLVAVSRHPEVNSSWEGSVVLEDLDPAQLGLMRHMLLVMDPPGHTTGPSGTATPAAGPLTATTWAPMTVKGGTPATPPDATPERPAPGTAFPPASAPRACATGRPAHG